MEHPALEPDEQELVELLAGVVRNRLTFIEHRRAALIAYALVAELADLCLEKYGRACPPPPASLCGVKLKRGGNVLHCKLAVGHAGPCCHD